MRLAAVDYVERLAGVDPRLSLVMLHASFEFARESGHLVRITEGLRTKKRQAVLLAEGKSQTMFSYHLQGRAVDVAIIKGHEALWDHWLFEELNSHVQMVANHYGLAVTWGGSWATLVDAVHWQLEAMPHEKVQTLPGDGV